jgi:uncharacterized membrane protein
MPDFWRKELWHPLTVHFPIALLLVATVLLVVSILSKKEYKNFFQNTSFLLLVIGTCGAWIAQYTGDIADGIVSRKICDPTILKDHELAAQTMTYLFSAGTVLSILLFFNLLRTPLYKIALYVILGCMLAGSVFLVRTGHLGASVVYEQGGGVLNHNVDCDDFQ